jgi:hypothetical protein
VLCYFDARLREAVDAEFEDLGVEVLMARIFIGGGRTFDDPFAMPYLSFKVRFAVHEGNTGWSDSVGIVYYMSDLSGLPCKSVQKIADHLTLSGAKQMRAYVEQQIADRKPLPIRALTAADRETICLPF